MYCVAALRRALRQCHVSRWLLTCHSWAEDKWSAFKDIDFSTPAATTSTPGGSAFWDSSSNQTSSNQTSASNDLWGTTSDTSANNLWGSSKSSDAQQTPNPFGGSLFSSESPAPTTSAKKETTFGASRSPIPPSQSLFPESISKTPELEQTNQTRKCDIYKALYDFEARNSDELTFKTDEKIKVSQAQPFLSNNPLSTSQRLPF